MVITGRHMIGGDFVHYGHETFKNFNPKMKESFPVLFCEAGDEELALSMQWARQAFLDYRKKSPAERAVFLRTIADAILDLGDELITTCHFETALPHQRLISERTRTVNQLRLFAEYLLDGYSALSCIDPGDPARLPLPKPDIRLRYIPIGPVAVFGASNFPLAFSVAGGDTASALAAGCSVVCKAHPAHPATSELVGRAIVQATEKLGIPKGIFALLQGKSVGLSQKLVAHPDIKAVGFTGSLATGRILFDIAAQRPEPIPVYAEMGSINPIFLLPEKLKTSADTIAKEFVNSFVLGAGQFCTNPGVVVGLKGEDFDAFRRNVKKYAALVNTQTLLTPGIKASYSRRLEQCSDVPGVSVLFGTLDRENFSEMDVDPTVFEVKAESFLQYPELRQEIFGPTSLIVEATSNQEMLKVAGVLQGELTATIHGTDSELKTYRSLIELLELKVGRLIFNGFPTGVEVCRSMQHGGPYPATTHSLSTSVGTRAILRFLRPICYQNMPRSLLPEEIKDE